MVTLKKAQYFCVVCQNLIKHASLMTYKRNNIGLPQKVEVEDKNIFKEIPQSQVLSFLFVSNVSINP